MNVVKVKEIAIGDLVETKNNVVGVVTEISKKGLCLTTINDDLKIFCKDIKAIRFLPPKCLKHGNRNCIICNQKQSKNKCERCGKQGGFSCLDPYDIEVNEVVEKYFLCEECYQERVDAI